MDNRAIERDAYLNAIAAELQKLKPQSWVLRLFRAKPVKRPEKRVQS